MPNTFLSAVERFTAAHAGRDGIARAPIPGMRAVRFVAPTDLQHAIMRPLICLVVQGTKEVTVGTRELSFSAGDSMLIDAHVPTISRVTQASRVEPYLSFALYLDIPLIAELSAQMNAAPIDRRGAMRLQPTDSEVAETALRLLRLVDRPASISMLQAHLVRELHYWLLVGRHGDAIRHLGWPRGHARRIGRAIEVIRAEFAQPLLVDRLATIAGMSRSSFHHHFRAATSLSPLQFQKKLRLIEARRLMMFEGISGSEAAFAVGYESAPQFTREYGRLFGAPPVREVERARHVVADQPSL